MYVRTYNSYLKCPAGSSTDDGDNTTGAIVGVVVGGVCGGILLILLTILLWLCCIKKRGEKSSRASMECMFTVLYSYI